MFTGYWNIGSTAFCLVTSENSSGVSAAADSLPTFRVYGASATPVATGTASAFDAANLTGVYLISFSITGGFARGSNYHIVASYDVSAQPHEKVFSMSVM